MKSTNTFFTPDQAAKVIIVDIRKLLKDICYTQLTPKNQRVVKEMIAQMFGFWGKRI